MLAHALRAIVSLASSLKSMRQEVRELFKEHDEFRVRWEQADGADEGRSTSATSVVEQTRGPLARACNTILSVTSDHEKQLILKSWRSGSVQAQVTDLKGQVMNVKDLLRISHSKERIARAAVKSLDSQWRNVLGHLSTLRSQMPGPQARVAEDFKAGLFCNLSKVTTLLSDLAVARQRDIGGALSESMTPL